MTEGTTAAPEGKSTTAAVGLIPEVVEQSVALRVLSDDVRRYATEVCTLCDRISGYLAELHQNRGDEL